MPKDIKIRKGFTLKLKGEAEKVITTAARSQVYAIKPPDFHGMTPKMVVKVGDKVKAGDPLFFSKYNHQVQFVSPVSGTIQEVLRGSKRRILEVKIAADAEDTYKELGKKGLSKMTTEEVKQHLLTSGCWPFIKQRPYDVIADPEDMPKAIFVSAYTTAPLVADITFTLEDRAADFQAGMDVLQKLTVGKVHLCVKKRSESFLHSIEGAEIHKVSGPHPAGNVGVQIHHIDPINAGERVWVVHPEDVAIIGSVFLTGKYLPQRTVAVVGSSVKNPKYCKTLIGAEVASLTKDVGIEDGRNARFISGDVLTGTRVAPNGYLGFYDNTFTVIPEGNNYRMFGWLPFVDNYIPSLSKTSLSWLFPNKKYVVDTNLNGEERALVVTGEMEKVFPMDIYPMQLLKECMAGDIEKMENLGIYEVAPEDFAVIDFSCTSKIEAQQIIREGLDLMIEEVG